MNQHPQSRNNTHTSPFILRFIIIIYLIIFICALTMICYLFSEVVAVHPIILIDLLKYLLLSVIFAVLLVNGIKALLLKTEHLIRFESSVKNFKWLFSIALVIAMAAKAGLFNESCNKNIEISSIHIGFLIAAVLFCSWSDKVLEKEVPE